MVNIPYGHQYIDDEDINQVVEVLRSDWLTQGPKVKKFEDELCEYTGAKYAVALSSGTAALHLACIAAGINQGYEVITSPLTFVASANCILYCKGKPVFADIEADTANISLREVESKITGRTRAIIPVHYSGHPCELEDLYTLAKENGVILIEDSAHALGAEYKGSKIGSCKYSDMCVFSFHPVKSITTGEGGAITTNNRDYYDKLIMLRQHGITKNPAKFLNPYHLSHNPEPWYYEMHMLGFNYRITDFQCALGISQLKKLEEFIKKRGQIVSVYNEAFKNNAYFDLPVEKEQVKSSWHLYPVRLKDKFRQKKTIIFNRLRAAGLGVQVHYIPVYLQPYYRSLGYKEGICPGSEDFYNKEFSLPLYPHISQADADYVIQHTLFALKDI